jgi:hypothetical protein
VDKDASFGGLERREQGEFFHFLSLYFVPGKWKCRKMI